MKLKMIVVLLYAMIVGSHGYPYGPPLSSCTDMFPAGHEAFQETTAPPYSITLSQNMYNPGDRIEVSVESTGDPYFEGLFIQARRASCDTVQDVAIGSWEIMANDSLRLLDCHQTTASAVSHQNEEPPPGMRRKRDGGHHYTQKNMTWIAPNSAVGHLVFVATIVYHKQTFWMAVESPIVKDASISPVSDNTTECNPVVPPPVPTTTQKTSGAMWVTGIYMYWNTLLICLSSITYV